MSMQNAFLAWHLLVPLALALVIFAVRWHGRSARAVIVTLHLISVSLVLVFSLWTARDVLDRGPLLALGEWLHVDALAAIFLGIIGVVGFLVGLYSVGYTRHELESGAFDNARLSTYYGLFNLFLFTMLLTVTANNIIMMWVAVEATTLGSAFLVGIHGKHASLEAAWKYVIICTVGVAFALYGTVLIYADAVNVMQRPDQAVLWTAIVQNAAALEPTLVKMAFVFVLIGFGTKAGLFPMHAWLPDAHSEAPSPVSALLSGVLLNCALLIIFRFATVTGLSVGPQFAQTLFVVFGALSVAAAAFFMYAQRDVKRLLAYSSTENIGLIVLAFGLGGPLGVFAGLLQAVNHSLAKSLMFCLSGNILIKYGSRSLERVRGMLQTIPLSGALMLAGALALAGAPPFNIFLSKFLIIVTGLGSAYRWVVIVCLLLLTIVFAAFVRLIGSAVFGARPDDLHKGEAGWLTLAPVLVLLALVLMLGVYLPPPLWSLLQQASGVPASFLSSALLP